MKGRLKRRGTKERPRLAVHKSHGHIYAQIIDDEKGETLVSASSSEKQVIKKIKSGSNIPAAKFIGEEIARRAVAKKIKKVMFDRGDSLYHGRVKALADAARQTGLEF